MVDSRSTIYSMKLAICAEINNVNPDEIVLKRMSKVGLEVKNLSKIINSTSINNNSKIYVQFGIPTKEDEYVV